ncbi:MAG TPA: cupin domain-containing protein [Ilumatobacteraceae bacterium]|nr:cupin domain-containing protein [Ilumatobacteraceae bacterium]
MDRHGERTCQLDRLRARQPLGERAQQFLAGECGADTKEEVLADIARLDLWPTTYVSERMEELPLHWHDVDNCGYVLEGSSYFLDEHGHRVELGPGDKLVLPAGAIHAEGRVTERMIYIVGISKAGNLFDALLPCENPRPAQCSDDPLSPTVRRRHAHRRRSRHTSARSIVTA